jgi:hypothetical protein
MTMFTMTTGRKGVPRSGIPSLIFGGIGNCDEQARHAAISLGLKAQWMTCSANAF